MSRETGAHDLQVVIDFYLALCQLKHGSVREHSERVGKLARAAAHLLQMDVQCAYTCGCMHDIGKVVLPADLFDGHNITADEYRLVQDHAILGYEVLSDRFLFTAVTVGLHHAMRHERSYGLRWDALPDLLGNDTVKKILDMATLVGICDCADAFLHRTTTPQSGPEPDLAALLRREYPESGLMVDTVLGLARVTDARLANLTERSVPTDDEPGYPTEAELERIATWPPDDFIGWMAYVRGLWAYADWGWREKDGLYAISTAGWSGNESLIAAMQRNYILWTLHWRQSRCGGHYELRSREAAKDA